MNTQPFNNQTPLSKNNMLLQRKIGLGGALLLGLGSIIGTGLFLSLGLAANITGTYFILALLAAGFVALCNALNSAQLASLYPTSGGAYEYGYQLLHPHAGFTAGFSFLVAKSASAASATLGLAFALQKFLNVDALPIALTVLLCTTVCAALGLKKSNFVNTVILFFVLTPLFLLITMGCYSLSTTPSSFSILTQLQNETFSIPNFLQATAILFVAYTGYGRIATLGEEVLDPKKTIPRSIILTLATTLVLYLGIAVVLTKGLGTKNLQTSTLSQHIPVVDLAQHFQMPTLAMALTLAASLSLVSVLLNLILGLSRMLLAMARRGDAPQFLQKLSPQNANPTRAVLTVGMGIGCLILTLGFSKNWSVSAFSILIYYAVVNAAALKIKKPQRLYPSWLAACGLLFCCVLAYFIEMQVWLVGTIILLVANGIKLYQSTKLRNFLARLG